MMEGNVVIHVDLVRGQWTGKDGRRIAREEDADGIGLDSWWPLAGTQAALREAAQRAAQER